ncbi:MAG: putative ATP-dependent endonuclease of the family [Thermosipho sp. (in: thermotogales)]|nr:putative ATP-dependent endonuclease of the family [Petrotoga sp.]MDN5325244.1 putative ATP-dependent endonuclease of the family [Thermosipho sp. (in: thermotogales)]
MYLSKLNIWNFRKFGQVKLDGPPKLSVNFKKGLNLIVGENDSGKTTIIDAIKLVLGTQSYEKFWIDERDFYRDPETKELAKDLKIECIFDDLTEEEGGRFLEWITFNENNVPQLKVRLVANMKDNKIKTKITAGDDNLDINFEARDLLRVTYLKPLRDAENELTPGYRSRFYQILKNYDLFFKNDTDIHVLEKYMEKTNRLIEEYFEKDTLGKNDEFNIEGGEKGAREITEFINNTLESFMGIEYKKKNYKARVNISGGDLYSILSKLGLSIEENKAGLGSLNQLYIAMELLLSEKSELSKIILIEEIEAHLHPQAQLRLIKYLQKQSNDENQYILTTHSITLASVVNLEKLIICSNNQCYPMGNEYTKLEKGDYEFLERFLDATKANLFFAKGVILVEGVAENLLIPAIAEIIDKPLDKYGISVVNIEGLSFLRYSKIFLRKKGGGIGVKVAIVTDLDVKPEIYYIEEENIEMKEVNIEEKKRSARQKKEKYNEEGIIKVFTNNWTLEYDLGLSGIRDRLFAAILAATERKKDENSKINFENFLKTSREKIKKWKEDFNYSDEKIAYEIYKPLLKNKTSKAVVAQYLAKNLLENKSQVKEVIQDDPYIKYIIDAINFVTSEMED